MTKEHAFTQTILQILEGMFPEQAQLLFRNSLLLQYLNIKTRSANRGSKSRGAFANHYALYVLIEDYINKGFVDKRKGEYRQYDGARFTDLFKRQRELPFGAKLQNHALNSRLNDEFSKYFPAIDLRPIIRDQGEQKYWINEQLLIVSLGSGQDAQQINIAEAIIAIIDKYIETKKSAFERFIATCKNLSRLTSEDSHGAVKFVEEQLQPSVDARVFEIISFAILKAYYGGQSIFWGWSIDNLSHEFLVLYKTGRTNANDGGIDFVMKPLGRFFQVTETIDVNKYFLDIDKIHRFPLTFVVKSLSSEETVRHQLCDAARHKYGVDAIVMKYMDAVEEIINIPQLLSLFSEMVAAEKLPQIMDEIILQSRAEFNIDEGKDV